MVVNYGWKPGDFINLNIKQKGLFLAYQEKMSKDEKWKKIMELKVGIRI